jgi:8-oxo-dGTP diphosphatase
MLTSSNVMKRALQHTARASHRGESCADDVSLAMATLAGYPRSPRPLSVFETGAATGRDRLIFAGMDIRCVGAVIRDAEGRLLVVRRGRPPSQGRWSIPGGRVEAGESDHDAVRREVWEETGLQVEPRGVAGAVVLPAADPGDRYLVTDYLADLASGDPTEPQAGDDADEARWVLESEFLRLDLVAGLAQTLQRWEVWSSPSG